MGGERNLRRLLASMRPSLRPEVFTFATLPRGSAAPAGLAPVMVFHETEGPTLIVERAAAETAGLAATFPCRMITLEVHSSLDAVGFLAALAARLAAAGMPVNPVSGYHHDHLFVPEGCAAEAVALLETLAAEAAEGQVDEGEGPRR